MKRAHRRDGCVALVLAALAFAALAPAAKAQPRSVVELQSARTSETVALQDAQGRQGQVTLTNLNPTINAFFVLTLQWPDGAPVQTYHLENASPAQQGLSLQPLPGQLALLSGGKVLPCELWSGKGLAMALDTARRVRWPYAPLCGGRLFLRNAVRGNRSALESTTEFLRDRVPGGEQIVGLVRRELYQDAFVERAAPSAAAPAPAIAATAPPPARVDPASARRPLAAPGLGIEVGSTAAVPVGQWLAATGLEGVYVSVAPPGALQEGATRASGRGLALDAVESQALAYLVAFDLSRFEVGFALGTEHPRLGWSARVPPQLRTGPGPGPDGFDSAAPLVRTGMVSPAVQPRVVATFTAGFKREHGAFRYGELAAVNHGSHYGFVEQGVVYSSLQPGLSTLYVLNDGTLGMKTWTADDARLLPTLRHARQNGVPLLERGTAAEGADPRSGAAWGALVDAWGPGNWSGSSDEKLRSLRSGACLVDDGARRFLVYGYFSSATPRAMARTFGAYGCSYAMHLDMNALEHTYLALYVPSGAGLGVEHLVAGMAALDKRVATGLVPRFLGFADDRDFFYVMAKKAAP